MYNTVKWTMSMKSTTPLESPQIICHAKYKIFGLKYLDTYNLITLSDMLIQKNTKVLYFNNFL